MRARGDILLEDFCSTLQSGLPVVQWNSNSHTIGVLSGHYDRCYRVRLCANERLVSLFMNGLIPKHFPVLSEINELVSAPLRVAQRRPRGPYELRATWPVELSTKHQAQALASDLNHVISGPLDKPHRLPINEQLVRKLSAFITSTDNFQRIPASDDIFEFIVGKGKNSLQVRVTRTFPEMVTLCSFVTNHFASDQLSRRVSAMVVFLLNARLNWGRLVLVDDSVINVEVAVPVSSLSPRVWRAARKILSEGLSYRRLLWVVQQRVVAEEIQRVWIN